MSSVAKKTLKISLKISLKILYQILVIFCIILTIIIVLQKISNSNRTILGYRLFRIITGSMEPEYDVGTVVICKETPINEIKVGDDIVYLGTYGEYNGKIIMHEVVEIDKDEKNNNINFHAQGTHNSSIEDPQIKPNQIFGVVKFQSVILTKLYELATNPYTSFVIITVLVLNVFISFKYVGKNKKEEIYQLEEQVKTVEENTENLEDVEIEDIGKNEDIENIEIEKEQEEEEIDGNNETNEEER